MWLKQWTLVICGATNFYLLGVMVLFATVVYPQFGVLERGAFVPAYQSFTGRIGLPVVAFEFIAALASLILYVGRPSGVSLSSVHLLTVFAVGYFAITFGWHLPAQRALAAGDNSLAALDPLLASQWARCALQAARAFFLLWLGATHAMLTPRP